MNYQRSNINIDASNLNNEPSNYNALRPEVVRVDAIKAVLSGLQIEPAQQLGVQRDDDRAGRH